MYIQLQGSSDPLRFRLRLLSDLIVKILQNGYILRPGVCHVGSVDCPDASVDQGLFHRFQTVTATGCQLTEGQNEVRFQSQGVIVLAVIQVDIHGIYPLITGRRDLNDLTAQLINQGEILRFRVTDNDIVPCGQEDASYAHLRAKGLAAAGGAKYQTVGGL